MARTGPDRGPSSERRHALLTALTIIKGYAQLPERQLRQPELERARLQGYADAPQTQVQQLIDDLRARQANYRRYTGCSR